MIHMAFRHTRREAIGPPGQAAVVWPNVLENTALQHTAYVFVRQEPSHGACRCPCVEFLEDAGESHLGRVLLSHPIPYNTELLPQCEAQAV